MTSKPIALPDPIWQLMHQKVASGEFRDESEYLATLAQADLHRQKLHAWERCAEEMDRGMARPLTSALGEGDLDDIVREAEAAVAEETRSHH